MPLSYMNFKSQNPLPDETCPKIDGAIDLLNAIRSDNATLRAVAIDALRLIDQWEDHAENLSDTIESLEKTISELQDEISNLHSND